MPVRKFRTDEDTFPSEEVSLLTTFATFAAQAIETARRYDEAAEQARTDALTGLSNRRELERILGAEVRRAQRYGHSLALLMLDLDNFKKVNDAYGHLAGDEVLRALAERVRRTIRPVDLAARYGGEELALVLPETPGPGACRTAERIRRAIASTPFGLPDGQEIGVTVSIGVSWCLGKTCDARTPVSQADQALYAAKGAGRDQVILYGGAQPEEIG